MTYGDCSQKETPFIASHAWHEALRNRTSNIV